MQHVSEVLRELLDELVKNRDQELVMAHEVAVQYITDHNDREAFKQVDKDVARLGRAWDQMIAKVEK